MTDKQLQWWRQFVIDEKALGEKWESTCISEQEKKEIATANWPLTHLHEYDLDVEDIKAQLI